MLLTSFASDVKRNTIARHTKSDKNTYKICVKKKKTCRIAPDRNQIVTNYHQQISHNVTNIQVLTDSNVFPSDSRSIVCTQPGTHTCMKLHPLVVRIACHTEPIDPTSSTTHIKTCRFYIRSASANTFDISQARVFN